VGKAAGRERVRRRAYRIVAKTIDSKNDGRGAKSAFAHPTGCNGDPVRSLLAQIRQPEHQLNFPGHFLAFHGQHARAALGDFLPWGDLGPLDPYRTDGLMHIRND
jgi:hypothetical protein